MVHEKTLEGRPPCQADGAYRTKPCCFMIKSGCSLCRDKRNPATGQGAFFDEHDTPEIREHGTNIMLDTLGKIVEGEVRT